MKRPGISASCNPGRGRERLGNPVDTRRFRWPVYLDCSIRVAPGGGRTTKRCRRRAARRRTKRLGISCDETRRDERGGRRGGVKSKRSCFSDSAPVLATEIRRMKFRRRCAFTSPPGHSVGGNFPNPDNPISKDTEALASVKRSGERDGSY